CHLLDHASRLSLVLVYACARLSPPPLPFYLLFFFNNTATTEIYTLSLHDALPISRPPRTRASPAARPAARPRARHKAAARPTSRSEEYTSELQSLTNLVCRLLLEKKKSPEKTRTIHEAASDRWCETC